MSIRTLASPFLSANLTTTARVLTTVLGVCSCLLVAYTAVASNPATSPPAATVLERLMKPFRFVIGYIRCQRGKARRNKEREEAGTELLATDPEGLEHIDHEMGIRVRAM